MTEEPQHKKRNKLSNVGIVVAVVLATVTVLGASQIAQKQLDHGTTVSKQCDKAAPTNHMIFIENDVATPEHTEAHQCDTLTITNRDDQIRLMAFGIHEAHAPYDGMETKLLSKDQSFTVTLVEPGQIFRVHDHEHDEVQATFTVTPL
jgi:hypothetical protein